MERKRSTAPLFCPQGHFSGLATHGIGFITQHNLFMHDHFADVVITTLWRRHILLRAIFVSFIFVSTAASNYCMSEDANPPHPTQPAMSFTPPSGTDGQPASSGSSPDDSGWEVPKRVHKHPPPELPDAETQKLEQIMDHKLDAKLDSKFAKFSEAQAAQAAANQKYNKILSSGGVLRI